MNWKCKREQWASPERMGWDRRGLQNTKRRQDEEEKKSKFAWEGRGMVVVVSCVRHRPILSASTFTALSVGQGSQFLGSLKRAQLVGKEPR